MYKTNASGRGKENGSLFSWIWEYETLGYSKDSTISTYLFLCLSNPAPFPNTMFIYTSVFTYTLIFYFFRKMKVLMQGRCLVRYSLFPLLLAIQACKQYMHSTYARDLNPQGIMCSQYFRLKCEQQMSLYIKKLQLSVNYKTTSYKYLTSNVALPTLTLHVSWLSSNNYNASAFSLGSANITFSYSCISLLYILCGVH